MIIHYWYPTILSFGQESYDLLLFSWGLTQLFIARQLYCSWRGNTLLGKASDPSGLCVWS